MKVLRTDKGIRFGLWGEKPTRESVLLLTVADVGKFQTQDVHKEIARRLAQDGVCCMAVDPPCHGEDIRDGEPIELKGWAHRVKRGDDLMDEFADRASHVLDHLLATEDIDPERVVAVGTSRGGFCALHLAARDSRVRVVAAIGPVTELSALSEFAGIEADPATTKLDVRHLAPALAGRPIRMTMGHDYGRVSTDACVRLARTLATANAKLPEDQRRPVELVLMPTEGHTSTPEDQSQTSA